MAVMQAHHNILALDIGERRIGVAVANALARLPRSLTTLDNNDSVLDELKSLVTTENISTIVVGLPRGMNGQETDQTKSTREFAKKIEEATSLRVSFQDETLTSVQAEAELKRSGKPYNKASIDAMAAVYILEDFLKSAELEKTIHV